MSWSHPNSTRGIDFCAYTSQIWRRPHRMPCATWSPAITVGAFPHVFRASVRLLQSRRMARPLGGTTYGHPRSAKARRRWTTARPSHVRLRAYEPCHCSHRRIAASIRTHRLITTRNCALSTASRSRARSTGFDSAMGDETSMSDKRHVKHRVSSRGGLGDLRAQEVSNNALTHRQCIFLRAVAAIHTYGTW